MTYRTSKELAGSAWARYKSNALLFVAIAGLPVLILGCVSMLSYALMQAGGSYSAGAVGFFGIIGVAVMSALSTIALVLAVHDSAQYSTWQRAYEGARQHFWTYIIASALVTLAVLGGLLLLIVPGIIFLLWFSMTNFTVIIEGARGRAALRASRTLVTGRMSIVATRLALLVVIYIFSGLVIGISLSAVQVPEKVADVLANALGILVSPFGTAYLYELYLDLKSATTKPEKPSETMEPA